MSWSQRVKLSPELPVSMTKIHRRLIDVVERLGFSVIVEAEFPPYRVDVYCPEAHIAFEADGPLHRRKRDRERDAELLRLYGLLVSRFTYRQLRSDEAATKLEQNIIEFIEAHANDAEERKAEAEAVA
jgi:very-short-patch-repair endonuclease